MRLRRVGLCCVILAFVAQACALDREAFSFTKYDLDLQVEPAQQRLGARGTVTLRNDSAAPQKVAVLQISSSLTWHSIKANGKQLQFVSQPYTSDIDHTGALSEAVVTLPEAIPPKGTTTLEIAYEGVIVLDATRFTRIGAPEAMALSNDWDQISPKFTAVRGVGNVAWYPTAEQDVDLSESSALAEALQRWRSRELDAEMTLRITVANADWEEKPEFLINASNCPKALEVREGFAATCNYQSFAAVTPAFIIAGYDVIERAAIAVHFLPGHDTAASAYADAAEKVQPFIGEWFGAARNKAQVADLADASAVASESGSFLMTPLVIVDSKQLGLMAAHQLTHAAFFSRRPWMNEGLAHFAQALYVERTSGRQGALDYMKAHTSTIGGQDKTEGAHSDTAMRDSLINTAEEQTYRSKGMYVWWMLRDMVGDAVVKKALASYRAEDDKEPSYMQRLLQAQTSKDLEWFFDDWVYRERGLPDFKVESAFSRKTLPEGYMLTVTVSNAGDAGAEVPLTVKFTGGEVTKRLIVRGKSNAVIRVETPQAPDEIIVNDGSVPESDETNNRFKVVNATAN